MSDRASSAPRRPRVSSGVREDRRRPAQKDGKHNGLLSFTDLSEFLTSLTDAPVAKVHVNGPQFPQAVVTVDFGVPLRPGKLSNDQATELVGRMRRLTRDLVSRECRVGIFNDAPNGIWWTALT